MTTRLDTLGSLRRDVDRLDRDKIDALRAREIARELDRERDRARLGWWERTAVLLAAGSAFANVLLGHLGH